jgi:mono/diheme cytochrome c family protein
MKTKYILSSLVMTLFLILFSCQTKQKKTDISPNMIAQNVTDSTGKELFNQKCMICHSTEGKDDKTMLAPPFYQVKNRYLKASMDQSDFVVTMSNWVKNPSADNALMRGAVEHFNIMPQLGYTDADIKLIVNYIYNNEMPKPDWFDAHQREHSKNKQGKGHGHGYGRNRP